MQFTHSPLSKLYITQAFGARPEFYRRYGLAGHNGLDFRTRFLDSPMGRRQIYAVLPGVVIKVVNARVGGYGTYIVIEHEDGTTTLYGHQFHIWSKLHDNVSGGEVIGISDNTGDSSGPHLHLGVRPAKPNFNNGYKGWVDPILYMRHFL
jgi:murein DD-endopeptidase MepM/ murein hydrolase activator NlpD